jgi:hypothetical protein
MVLPVDGARDTSSPGSFARPWPPPTSTDTLHLALQASGLDKVGADRRPRLLSDNGPSYAANDLSDWLEGQGKKHTREKPYHPMTQGKIERWHLSLKSPILLESYYLPGDLERAVADFVEHYNHRRYLETSTTSRPLTSTSAEASASSSGESTSSAAPSSNVGDSTSARQHELQPDEPKPLLVQKFTVPKNLTTDSSAWGECIR